MKIIITGTNGFIGYNLAKHFKQKKGVTVYSITRKEEHSANCFNADITDFSLIKMIVDKVQPDVIVHCAAISKPNECETNKNNCWQTNVEATKNLIDCSKIYKTHFIFFSTDFVYGEGKNHREEGPLNPLCYYAESKIEAEKYLIKNSKKYTIIRPVLVYGKIESQGKGGFIQWVYNSLLLGKEIKIVTDQIRTPTFINDIIKSIEIIINQKKCGKFNLAGNDQLSPYQMAILLANEFSLNKQLILPVTANEFNEPALRAKVSIVNTAKAKKELGFYPTSFTENIKLCF
jgi:dTDP-4-dehydrorhamnose reductase